MPQPEGSHRAMPGRATKTILAAAYEDHTIRAEIESQCIAALRYRSGDDDHIELPPWAEFIVTWLEVGGTGSWTVTVRPAMGDRR